MLLMPLPAARPLEQEGFATVLSGRPQTAPSTTMRSSLLSDRRDRPERVEAQRSQMNRDPKRSAVMVESSRR